MAPTSIHSHNTQEQGIHTSQILPGNWCSFPWIIKKVRNGLNSILATWNKAWNDLLLPPSYLPLFLFLSLLSICLSPATTHIYISSFSVTASKYLNMSYLSVDKCRVHLSINSRKLTVSSAKESGPWCTEHWENCCLAFHPVSEAVRCFLALNPLLSTSTKLWPHANNGNQPSE